VPRCTGQKERNVLDHLVERDHSEVKQRPGRAWADDDYDRALSQLKGGRGKAHRDRDIRHQGNKNSSERQLSRLHGHCTCRRRRLPGENDGLLGQQSAGGSDARRWGDGEQPVRGLERSRERHGHRPRRGHRQHDGGDAAHMHGQLNEQKQLLKYQRVGFCGGW
jgi:hypothetical protein